MRIEDISKLDIKLLIAFVTIMEEGSVSRAAERLNLTQPALSKSLQRLRDLFNDALFTRQAYGLSPTSRASELHQQVKPILRSLTELMEPASLDIHNLNRRFRLAVSDCELESFIEPLLDYLHVEAPNTLMSISTWSESSFDGILNGIVDIGISPLVTTPGHIRTKLVGHTEGCIILSAQHPLFDNETLSLKELISHKFATHHIKHHNNDYYFYNTLDKLQQQGYNLEPTLETESLMVAMKAVKRGMAFLVSRSVGELFRTVMNDKGSRVKIFPLPKEVSEIAPYEERHPIQICWHERNNNDLAHRWFREKVIQLMRETPWITPP